MTAEERIRELKLELQRYPFKEETTLCAAGGKHAFPCGSHFERCIERAGGYGWAGL